MGSARLPSLSTIGSFIDMDAQGSALTLGTELVLLIPDHD